MGQLPPDPLPPDPPPEPPPDPPYPPPDPPEPPEPPQPPLPPGCNPPTAILLPFTVSPQYFNPCVYGFCDNVCDMVYGQYVTQSSGCESPFSIAWYEFSSCTCTYFDDSDSAWIICGYRFIGCNDSYDNPPAGLTAEQMTAFTLSFVYNFNPLDGGKYEPDAFPGNPIRSMRLANWHDKTNLLVTYDPTII